MAAAEVMGNTMVGVAGMVTEEEGGALILSPMPSATAILTTAASLTLQRPEAIRHMTTIMAQVRGFGVCII